MSCIMEETEAGDTKTGQSPPQPKPGRCQYFVAYKKRFCRSIPPPGQKYCVEHGFLIEDNPVQSERKRIPCPICPKHSCYEDQLQRHLKKCNFRERDDIVYYQKNINAGEDTETNYDYKVKVSTVSVEEIMTMVQRVQALHAELKLEPPKELLFHEVLREETSKPTNGPVAQKHLQQQASLVGHMDKLGFLQDHVTYLEFGAGKGGMSHWVQRATRQCQHNKYILIEKSSIRYKMDSFHKGEDQGPSFERLRIDIQHINLNKVPSIAESDHPLIGMGKHLCGGATDFAIRCIAQATSWKGQHHEDSESGYCERQVKGVVIALCCHHRCDWKSYVGKEFFTKLGLGARDFHLICSMTSWATCAAPPTNPAMTDGQSEEMSTVSKTFEHSNGVTGAEANLQHTGYNHYRYGSLTSEEREEIGRVCKLLVDSGRVHYLQQEGLQARLAVYTDTSVSLENVVLLAHQGNS